MCSLTQLPLGCLAAWQSMRAIAAIVRGGNSETLVYTLTQTRALDCLLSMSFIDCSVMIAVLILKVCDIVTLHSKYTRDQH